ncbi:MAG: PAS domain S-box protein [Promethearchaeota archaeon]|nr:MAG: PAS domain S-box protein [Candidatus Lokiarchaeota archaeon]
MILNLEQKLKETEEILQILFENSPDIIMIIDDKGIILNINRIVPPLIKKDVIGKNSLDLIQTKYREIYKNALNNVFQKASRKYLEYRTLDGLFWLVRIIPIKKNQSITKAMVISTNITKKKEFKSDLIKEKAILDAALDSMRDIFFVYDPVHIKPIRWNKAFEEISGYTSEEISDLKSMEGIYDESDLYKAYNSLSKLIQTGKAISQLNLINKYGKIIPFEYSSSLIRNIDESTNYVVSIGRDLTERKKTEEIANFLTAIVESMDDAIIGKTLEGIITTWNDGAKRLYGYEEKEVIGKHINIIVPEDRYDEIEHFLTKLKNGEHVEPYETIRLNKNQEIINVSLRISPIFNKKGEIIGASTIARNISERIKEEQNFKRFITTITHELRTPITVISTSCNILKKHQNTLEDDEIKRLEENITNNIKLLEELSRELLMILQLEANEWKITWTKYTISHILKNLLFLHKKSLENKEFSYYLYMNDDLMLFGDPQRIEQVFHIIIDNAIKYSKENVILIIEAFDHYKGKYNPENLEGVLLIFNDNGLGIPEIDVPNIFERFYRSKEIINIPGTGLGLSIAKEIIKNHKGEIFVESELGKGSSFFVFLPHLN